MIYFLVKRAHTDCPASLGTGFGYAIPRHSVVAYEDFFLAESASPGTYIFCDLERLSNLELLAAAEITALMKREPGFRVLNDPARSRTRYGFLRAMREAGLNDFDAYRADGFPKPRRFPVFIRVEADHLASLTPLLQDQAALEAELERLASAAKPLRSLIVIEYCAEPVFPGVWRRLGTFRIGKSYHLHDVVSEDNWNVKYGKMGLVDEATYEEDHRRLESGFMLEELRRAFEIAEIDYGRADFGLVGGRPQVYEINTNPYISSFPTHPSPTRTRSLRLAQQVFASQLHELAEENAGGSAEAIRLSAAGDNLHAVRSNIRSAALATRTSWSRFWKWKNNARG